MSAEIWAKALTAMEKGAAPSIPTVGYAAAICDALDLSWQQHPVWLMYEAAQKLAEARGLGQLLAASTGVRAALDAAKGGG